MQLTSCLVNGNELISYLLVFPTSITRQTGDRVGTATLEFIGVASELGPLLTGNATVEIWSDGANALGALVGAFLPGATFPGGINSDQQQFVGKIARIEPVARSLAADGAGITQYKVQCQDVLADLDSTWIEEEIVFEAGTPTTDAEAIEQVFSTYAPTIDITAVVAQSTAVELRVATDWSVRKFLSELCARTGAVAYFVGSQLRYHAPSAVSAPFGIRDFQGEDTAVVSGTGLVGEVLTGEFLPGGPGDPIPVTQALYEGMTYTEEFTAVRNKIIIKGKAGDGGVRISSDAYEDAVSQATYGTRVLPIIDDNVLTTTEANTRAVIELAARKDPARSCSFKIRQDGLNIGQMITMRIPAIGMSQSYFINQVSLNWAQGLVTYTVDGGYYRPNNVYDQRKVAEDAKQKPYVAYAIPAPLTVLPGSFASSIEPVGLVNYPPNGAEELAITKTQNVVYNIYDKKTYRWDSSSNSYKRQVGAGDLAADSVTAGTIAVGAIRAVDAAFDAAAIKSADIESLSASKLTAGTIDAGTITVTNLSADNITAGTLNVDRLATASITGIKLSDGTVSSVKIASLEASKITAGTLDVGVIYAGDISADQITSGTITANVSISSGGFLYVAGGTTLDGGCDATYLQASGDITAHGNVYSDGDVHADGALSGASMGVTGDFGGGGTCFAASYFAGGTPGASGVISLMGLTSITVTSGLVTSWT